MGETGQPSARCARVAREAKRRGWWYRYTDVMPDWASHYIGMKTDASAIRTFEAQLVPGLLQTADYARAIIMSTAASTHIDVDRLVSFASGAAPGMRKRRLRCDGRGARGHGIQGGSWFSGSVM